MSTAIRLWVDVPAPFSPCNAVVEEGLDRTFSIEVVATSTHDDVDLTPIVGQPARLEVNEGARRKTWTGIVCEAELIHASARDLATYRFRIVPPLWLLTQRIGYRTYQYLSEVDVVLALLAEWDISPVVELDVLAYRRRKYLVQYGETDFAFFCRMLEDAGVSFWFIAREGHTFLVLGDRPGSHPVRATLPLRVDAGMSVSADWVRSPRRELELRPGAYLVRDVDPRLPPDHPLFAEARVADAATVESPLELYEFLPGFMQYVVESSDTPSADDRGAARSDERAGAALAARRLEAVRATRDVTSFESNVLDLAPADVIAIEADVPSVPREPLLVIGTRMSVSTTTRPRVDATSVAASVAWRPARLTPKPVVEGVESATVVGPPGEEIYTDEFGRVRVSFHWDRESKYDSTSSCWVPVAQPWAGRGYGGVNLPRIGQEVIVDFLGGDPDRPVITGRVYTNVAKVPYALPAASSESGWRSNSTGGKGGFNEIRWRDTAGQELFSMQAEQDLEEDVLHDDVRGIRGSRGIVVHGHETHDVVAGLNVHVTGRIDEDNWSTDTLRSLGEVAVTATTSIFANAQFGIVAKAKETIVLDADDIGLDCFTTIDAANDDANVMRISGPVGAAAAESLPPGGAAGFVAYFSQMLYINLGLAVPGDRPVTEAETEEDNLFEQERQARYEQMSDYQLRRTLELRRSEGTYGIDVERPIFSNVGDRQATIDALVAMDVRDREATLNRPVSPYVKNRLPDVRRLRPQRSPWHGRNKRGK